MIEQLKIKNFGPIKDVELQVKKNNILIGGQGTGKSTIAKIFTIFSDFQFLAHLDINSFKKFLKKYGLLSYYKKDSVIEYSLIGIYDIKLNENNISCSFQSDTFSELVSSVNNIDKGLDELSQDINSEELKKIFEQKITNLSKNFKIFTKTKKYIPAERIIISTIANSSFSFMKNDISLPGYILDFGELYESAKLLNNDYSFDFLNLSFGSDNSKGDFIRLKNNETVYLSEAASGYQSIIPLLICIDSISKDNISKSARSSVVIEEPENNIYPSTQYQLIKYITDKTRQCISIFITTHSPYTLTSLNNMIYAYQVGQKYPEKISQIIDKKYWLNPNEVSAYMMRSDGTAESIIDDDGLIKAEKIDEVSKIINKEFGSIMDIELGVDEGTK